MTRTDSNSDSDSGDRSTLHVVGVVVLVLALTPFLVFAAPQVVGAEHSYVVLSSSMSPTIHAGDVVVVNSVDPSQVEEGDVITFEPPGGGFEGAEYVTHRVVDVVEKNGDPHFETKGDANEEVDSALVPPENLVGEVWFHIPYIGRIISFAGTDTGLLAFVVIPAILLAVSEVYDLFVAAKAGEDEADEDVE